jgi:eukaryotic-like serine/threonine-protein kinase
VTSVAVTGDRATVALVDSWPAYAVVGPGDRGAAATVPARAATGGRMVLARTANGWRIDTVERVG